jgi:hypothetical protein
MKTQTAHRYLRGMAFFFTLSMGQAQTLVIPQVADGGGWQTTLVLTNTTANAVSASLSFFSGDERGCNPSLESVLG